MNIINTIDLTPICEAIIALLAAIVTAYLIPWIKSKTNEQQQAYIHAAVKVAVYAAEKLYGAGNGDAKLAYAERVLEDNYNIKLDAHKISAAVDAVIKEMEMMDVPQMLTGEIETGNESEAAEEDEEPQGPEDSALEV